MAAIHWKTGVSGSFNTASNWNPATVPTSTSDADIDASGTYTVTSSVSNTVLDVSTSATATLAISAGTFTANSFIDNAGTITVAPAAILALGSGSGSANVYNSGTINLNAAATGSVAEILVKSPVVQLFDGGTIKLSNSVQNRIVGTSTATELINRTNTISGAGIIGSANLTFVNAKGGTVNVSGSGNMAIATGSNAIVNAGLMETTGTGTLKIESNMSNAGNLIAAKGAIEFINVSVSGGGRADATVSGALIELDGATLSLGGVISTAVGSHLNTIAGTSNALGTSNLQNQGGMIVADNSTLELNATVYNSGTLQLAGSSHLTQLLIDGTGSSFNGKGKIALTDNLDNMILSDGTNQQLTNVDNTIGGSGTIGDAHLRFVNQTAGIVNSSGTKGLTIVGASDPTQSTDFNGGLIETTGTGGMTIKGTMGNGGTIRAAGSGQLTLSGFTDTSGGGRIELTTAASKALFSGVDIESGLVSNTAGTLTFAAGTINTMLVKVNSTGTMTIQNGATVVADNHWFNSSVINLSASTSATKLELGGVGNGLRFEGGGVINMGDSLNNFIVTNGSVQQLRNVNDEIGGSGTIGDANMTLQNEASAQIISTGTKGLTLTTGSNQIVNDGLLQSGATGGMIITSTLASNGTLLASKGILNAQAAVTGFGESDISGTGEIEFGAASSQLVDFSSATGILRLDHATTAASAFTGEVSGFVHGDKLDFSDILSASALASLSGATSTHATLNVTDGTHSTSLLLLGNYVGDTFAHVTDGHGGTFFSI